MKHVPLEKFDNERQLLCYNCHKEVGNFYGSMTANMPRSILCENCVLDMIDSMQCALSL
jgi:hypothetical protein